MRSAALLVAAWALIGTAVACETHRPQVTDPIEVVAAAEAPNDALRQALPSFIAADSCDDLVRLAHGSDVNSVVLAGLCPGQARDPESLRRRLMQTSSPRAAHALIAELNGHPELRGLAKLAALDLSAPPARTSFSNAQHALVYPVTDEVLAQVGFALFSQADDYAPLETRIRARAYLSRVHIQAVQALGIANGHALSPFARLLTGRALHYARSFCVMYWQQRVSGLRTQFNASELQILDLVIDLQKTPYVADDGLLAVEVQRSREYLQRPGPRSRLGERALARLAPFAYELDRLVAHGFVDLAAHRSAKASPTNPALWGVDLRQELTRRLLDADMHEYQQRVDLRLPTSSSPLVASRSLPPADESQAIGAQEMAVAIARRLRAAPLSGFARRHALAASLIELRQRPDTLRILLKMEHLAAFHPLMRAELLSRDTRSLASLRASTPDIQEDLPRDDAETRQAFALAARSTKTP